MFAWQDKNSAQNASISTYANTLYGVFRVIGCRANKHNFLIKAA
jgi:hypothetical protein